MDFGGLPPEINSGRMYAGPGSGPMLASAAAWASLGAEMNSAASSYGSVILAITSGPWVGPSSIAMATAVAPYVEWMSTTGEQAELAATQAYAAAAAYEAAFAMTVPPPVIVANRAQLMMLVATNFFGQNTPAIAATEAEYGEMWAQDAAAMYGYAASSATASQVTPFTEAPPTSSPAAEVTQAGAVAQATGSAAGTAQSTLSQLISTITSTLQSLASPAGLSSALNGLLGGSSSVLSSTGPLGGLMSTQGFSLGGLLEQYAYLPGFFGVFAAIDALGPLLSGSGLAAAAPAAVGADAAADGALGAAAADGALGAAAAGGADLSGLAGLGQAVSVGGLAVPQAWGWAAAGAAGPAALMGSVPLGMLSSAAVPLDVGGGLGFPFMFPGLGRGAAVAAGAGAIAGAAAAKHGSRLKVVARPPAAGYPAVEPAVAGAKPKYPPVPAGFPTNGHAPADV